MREKNDRIVSIDSKKFSIELSIKRRDVGEKLYGGYGLTSFLGSRKACRLVVCQLNL